AARGSETKQKVFGFLATGSESDRSARSSEQWRNLAVSGHVSANPPVKQGMVAKRTLPRSASM
ncbi:hypothetical protein A2U01_0067549, partial [Trifolium medium]|nr:hypothetical protein [Trifolium medium]